jgi:hypothetical protein
MIAGFLTPEAEEALRNLRERGTVRKHVCKDEGEPGRGPGGLFTPANPETLTLPPKGAVRVDLVGTLTTGVSPKPPEGKRLGRPPKVKPPRPVLVFDPEAWEPVRYDAPLRPTREYKQRTPSPATAAIREALKDAPAEGMEAAQLREATGLGDDTVRTLSMMRDVQVNRSLGKFAYRYRLKPKPPALVYPLNEWSIEL